MDIEQLKARLADSSLFRGIEHHSSIGSTNDRALALGRLGAPEGYLVTADSQSAGRGRLQRRWVDSPGGSLLVTLLLRPGFLAERWPLIGPAAAVAVARTAQASTGAAICVKWPNDVVAATPRGYGKLAGVLVETEGDVAVVGIGVNVSAAPGDPAGASCPPVCLAELCGSQVLREDLLVDLFTEFAELYRGLEDGYPEGILAAFSALDITKGRTVTLSGSGGTVTGCAEGMDEAGRILIMTEGTLRAFAAGDVTVSSGAVDEPHSQ